MKAMMEAQTEKIGRLYRDRLKKALSSGVESSTSTFLMSYSAITASQMDNLRKELKALGAQVYISKNRIAKLALKDLKQEPLADEIEGQTAFIFSNDDSASIAKTLTKFEKANDGVSIKGGLLDGASLLTADIKRLSDLPAKEILQAQLLQMILAPVTRFAGILNSKSRDLLSILKQLGEKKSEGGN